jgi:3-phenylpropionate/cinnamic acid dioxygenase small subunit
MASILEERAAIQDLLSMYCFHVDNGDYDQWVNLFTTDCLFEPGDLGNLNGRAAIREWVEKLMAGSLPRKHCTINSIIRVNGSEAKADSYLILVQQGAQQGPYVSLAGRYEDVLVKEGDTWLFKNRKIHFDFAGDLELAE